MRFTQVLVSALMAYTATAAVIDVPSLEARNDIAGQVANVNVETRQETPIKKAKASKTKKQRKAKATKKAKASKTKKAKTTKATKAPKTETTSTSSSSGETSSNNGTTSGSTGGTTSGTGEKVTLSAPQSVSGTFDGKNGVYGRGHACNSDADTGSANAVFILESGATLQNVHIGGDSLEGVHCKGPCTIKDVWFDDVCEDAITLLGAGDVLISGGGASEAIDKVVQHNGLSGTVTIENYTVKNAGKVYRGCGNCSKNGGPRHVIIKGGKFTGITADVVGINSNYGDTATIESSCGDAKNVCQEFKGVLKSAGVASAKLTTKTSCKGSQGQLDALPAC